MIPWELLGEARTPDGNAMTLTKRGSEYMIMAGGKDLISSHMKASEPALATIGCDSNQSAIRSELQTRA